MVKIHQHIKFQANPSMHSPADARKPLRTDGRTDGRTDRQTDGRTCRKTVTLGRVNQRTHVQVKRGYFRLRTDGQTDGQTDGRTDGQPENIMPLAPKGRGIKRCDRQTDRRTENTICRAAWSQLKTIGHFIYTTSSFVHHFKSIGEFKLDLQSRNAQFGSKICYPV